MEDKIFKSRYGRYFSTRYIQVLSLGGDTVKYREGQRFGCRWLFPTNAKQGTMSTEELAENFRQIGGKRNDATSDD